MFKLEFTTDNAAFEGDDGANEVARILKKIANAVSGDGSEGGTIHDFNGNKVGQWSLDFPEEEEAEDCEECGYAADDGHDPRCSLHEGN